MNTKKLKLSAALTVAAFSMINILSGSNPALAATQKWSWNIYGDCADYYDEYGDYAMFEEVESTCYVTAKVTPAKPARTFYLQYFDKKWVTESKIKTNSKGQVFLYPNPYDCGTSRDEYCDGAYSYRIWSPPVSGRKSMTGKTFELVFYPIDSDY